LEYVELTKAQLLEALKDAFVELKLIKKVKLKLRSAKVLINEL